MNKRTPNVFWPVLLIGVGVLLLFSNFDIIEPVNLLFLLQLWPLLLIAVGVQVLVGRDRAWVSNLISVGLVVLAIVLLIFAQDLGFKPPSGNLYTEDFSEPVGKAEAADVNIEVDSGSVTINALKSGDNLVEGEAVYMEDQDDFLFDSDGDSDKEVTIDLNQDDFTSGFTWFFFFLGDQEVGVSADLTPDIPLDLQINTGSGGLDLNLSKLELSNLSANTGSGGITTTIPAGDYSADLLTGSGSIKVTLESDADVDLTARTGSGSITLNLAEGVSGTIHLNTGSGSITVNAADGVGVKAEGGTGSGSIRGLILVSGDEDDGTWRSDNFEDSDTTVTIKFGTGSGSFRFRD